MIGVFVPWRDDRPDGPGYVIDGNGCHVWVGCVIASGYGQVNVSGRRRGRVHRLRYEREVGPVPPGLQIDHLCRNRACCNPAHLEAVTQKENIRRGVGPSAQCARQTHCKMGHEFTPENTYKSKPGRECRLCRKLRRKR